MALTDRSHSSQRKTGLFDAPSSPVGGEDGFSVAERAISVATGQLPHRVSNNTVRLQTELCEQVDLSNLEYNEAYIVHADILVSRKTKKRSSKSHETRCECSSLSQLLYRHYTLSLREN